MTPTSQEYKDQLEAILSNASDTLDDIYYSMREELEKEIIGEKAKREKIDQETKDIYDLLDTVICEKIIRKRLPWRIRWFNKITYRGMGIKSSGFVMIAFCFNENYSNSFERVFTIGEIKQLM